MDNLNAVDESNPVEENSSPKKRSSYVARDHVSMVQFVAAIYKSLGHTDYHTNKEIATVHQLSPDSIKQHLTSSQQYKLLELKFGVGYKITDLFKRIILPMNDSEKRAAIIESLKSPETYQPLFKEYEFHLLPPLNGIKNYFVRNFHFKDEIAEKTAQIFLNNLIEYDLIDSRGVLISGMKIGNGQGSTETEKTQETTKGEISPKKEASTPTSVSSDNIIDIVIPLKTSKRQAHLLLPDDYQPEDLERISKFVEALK
jgi:hypothetical protein